jgi:PTS system nitrogen regulatory IIA component
MNVGEIIKPEQVLVGLVADDKAKILSEVAQRAASVTGLDERTILEALTGRERLGSTGVGNGVAIPHASLDGLKNPFGLFIRLGRPIDFAAVDEKPVDLVFALLTSAGSHHNHISGLACISRRLHDRALTEKIRTAASAAGVYALLTH